MRQLATNKVKYLLLWPWGVWLMSHGKGFWLVHLQVLSWTVLLWTLLRKAEVDDQHGPSAAWPHLLRNISSVTCWALSPHHMRTPQALCRAALLAQPSGSSGWPLPSPAQWGQQTASWIPQASSRPSAHSGVCQRYSSQPSHSECWWFHPVIFPIK